MPITYASRRQPAAPQPTGALPRALATAVLLPLGALGLAGWLFLSLNIADPRTAALAATTPDNVRTVIGQVLTIDFTVERLRDAFGLHPSFLATAPCAPSDRLGPPADEDGRKACRALLATRLTADTGALAQAISNELLGSAPAPGILSSGPLSMRTRLGDAYLRRAASKWIDSLKTDVMTARLIASSWVPSAGATNDQRLLEAIDGLVAATRFDAELVRRLESDLAPGVMSSGVAIWSKDVSARLLWAVTALLFCATFIFVAVMAIDQISPMATGPLTSLLFWAGVGTLWIVVLTLTALDTAPANIAPLWDALAFFAQRYGVQILSWVTFLKILGIVGAVLLVVGSVATFLIEAKTAQELIAQLKGLRMLFNSGVVFTLSGVLTITALTRWPTVFYSDQTVRMALSNAADTVALGTGALFSVILLAVYVSSVVGLRQQARDLDDPADPDASATALKEFDSQGFGGTGLSQLMRIAQTLAPLLTSAAIGLLNVL